jgi:hypothetical protein
MRISYLPLCLALLAGCASSPPGNGLSAGGPDEATFVLTLGNDTLSAESFRRTEDRVEGTIVRRVPRAVVVRYVMTLAPNGMVTRLHYTTRLPDGSMPPNASRSVTVSFTSDSAITELDRDPPVVRRVAAVNAYPELEGGVFFFSRPIAALRATNRDSAHFTLYSPGATQPSGSPVARRDATRWWVYSFDSPIEIVIDDAGRIQSLDGSRTTFRVQARRQPFMDLSALAVSFLQRERAAGPLVALSPRDSLSATLGGAQISIGYGRPSARGRRIWGPNGVLGDTIWRTGANASTRITTTAPLMIGHAELAPGNYVVTTLAVPGRYHLILSQGDKEILRVPLSSRPLDPPVEQFTMVLEPTTDRAGVLRLRWDRLELSVPIRERQ